MSPSTARKTHLDALAITLLVVCCAFWGFQQILIKATVAEVPPLWQASLRFAATHVLSLTFFPRWLSGVEAHLQVGPIQTLSDSSHACEDLMLQRRVQFVLCQGVYQVLKS